MYTDFKEKLSELIAFKSISTDPQYKPHMKDTAHWITSLLESYGFKTQLIEGKETNPYVYGEYHVSDDVKTMLVYGHYDVQPGELEDGWTDEPFELVEREGRLYGRGVVDNKGQFLINIMAAGRLAKEGKLKYNMKFFIEGNEETGNAEIDTVIEENKELLSADYVLISDSEILGERPVLDLGFRGGFSFMVKYKTANNNLHSGIYGGAVPSATIELSRLMSKLFDGTKVNIPEFYEDIIDPTEEELENNMSLPFSTDDLEERTGVKCLYAEDGIGFHTQVGMRPSMTISGIQGGYTGEGYSNIVVAEAFAKINVRTVADQDYRKIITSVEKFVEENTPDYCDYSLEFKDPYNPIKIDTSNPIYDEIVDTLEELYGEKVARRFVGGGIPVVNTFKNVLGKDTVSMGYGNDDCNMHGTDENFRVDLVKKGLETATRIFSK